METISIWLLGYFVWFQNDCNIYNFHTELFVATAISGAKFVEIGTSTFNILKSLLRVYRESYRTLRFFLR